MTNEFSVYDYHTLEKIFSHTFGTYADALRYWAIYQRHDRMGRLIISKEELKQYATNTN